MKKQYFLKGLLLTFSLSFTAFVFMNTYEVVFNKDIILANSVSKFRAQDEVNATIQQFDIKPEANPQVYNATYGKLQYLQFPALSSNLYLEEKRVINGLWYVRPNLGQYVGLDKDSHGVIADYLIYTDSSWRTLPAPNQIEVGMDVNLYHDGHQLAAYKVAEKQVMPMQSIYVAGKSANRQIVLIIEDPKNNVYYGFSLVEKS